MPDRYDRREFIRRMLLLSAAGLAACTAKPAPQPAPAAAATPAAPSATALPARTGPGRVAPSPPAVGAADVPSITPTAAAAPHLAVARGSDPAEITRRAIAALGGIERFVRPGANVVIKPNICNAYHGPEFASTTNPDVIAAIVALCLGAGAQRVRVMDFPFGGSPQASYKTSGIADAVAAAGGQMDAMNRLKFRETAIPQGKNLRAANIYGDILDADTVINVPIAKNHGSATLTLGMKNLMGVIQDRNTLHARGLHQCIADLNAAIRPQLTVVDAYRMLMANGPTGGSLNDVRQANTVIASADVVAADAYAATLFGMQPAEIDYIQLGAEMGLGTMDLRAIKIEEIAV